VDWVHLALNMNQYLALVNTVMNLEFLMKADNFLTSYVTISFSKRTLLHGCG